MSLVPAYSDFISAGFFITRLTARQPYMSAELLPEYILSASACISTFIPDTWCLEWTVNSPERRAEDAQAFELGFETLQRLTSWVTPQFDRSFGWPNVILDLDIANRLVEVFLGHLDGVKVLEVGLHESFVATLCEQLEPPPQRPGFAPNGRAGVYEAILRRRQLSARGHVLGFEPLVFDHTLSHSWLCNGLETVVADNLGIRPNTRGMIDVFEDACKCVEYISTDEVGAEPGLWLPCLLMEHTLKS
jgi:hypothetical protein